MRRRPYRATCLGRQFTLLSRTMDPTSPRAKRLVNSLQWQIGDDLTGKVVGYAGSHKKCSELIRAYLRVSEDAEVSIHPIAT